MDEGAHRPGAAVAASREVLSRHGPRVLIGSVFGFLVGAALATNPITAPAAIPAGVAVGAAVAVVSGPKK